MSERLGDRVANTAVVAPLSIDMFPILIRRRLGQDGMSVMRRSFIAIAAFCHNVTALTM
jgi:hypothetical protein